METVRIALDRIGVTAYRRRGFGTEPEDLKEYEPGDEHRSIDWRATARRPPGPLGPELMVRERRKEVALEVAVVLDASASMGYGEKWPRALSLTGVIIEAVKAADRATVSVYSGGGLAYMRHVSRHMGHASPLVGDICAKVRPRGAVSLPKVAEMELGRQRRRRLYVVITDFAHEVEEVRRALTLLMSRGYPLAIMVLDKGELSVPWTAPTSLVDPESGRSLTVAGREWPDIGKALRLHVEAIVETLRTLGLPHAVAGPGEAAYMSVLRILSMLSSSRIYAYR